MRQETQKLGLRPRHNPQGENPKKSFLMREREFNSLVHLENQKHNS